MTYNLKYDVPLPAETYHAAHSAVKELVGDTKIGLIVHVAYPTNQGFGVVEVWESRESFDTFMTDVWPRVLEKVHAGGTPAPHIEPFDILGLIVGATDRIAI
jgi:hypothetical protein